MPTHSTEPAGFRDSAPGGVSSPDHAPPAPTDDPAVSERWPLLDRIAHTLGRRLVDGHSLGLEVGGDGFVEGFRLELEQPEGGTQQQVVYLETRPESVQRDGVLSLRDVDGTSVAVWLYPRDPELPALPAAVYPESAAGLLANMGVLCRELTLSLIAYRPGKRAVVRAEAEGVDAFLKVFAPRSTAALVEKYTTWHESGLPTPRLLGWSDRGLIAFAALPGATAAASLDRIDDHDRFLDEIVALQRAIAAVPSAQLARPSLATRVDWYEQRLAALMPEHSASIGSVGQVVARTLAATPAALPVTVHGDLHIGQVFIDGRGDVCGVLDIDTAGLGDPADDAAAFYAHLVVTALYHRDQPRLAATASELASRWIRRWPKADRSFALRAKAIAATHLLAHALSDAVPREYLLHAAGILAAELQQEAVVQAD
ncbi:phosphotransferase family protein [Ruicaihuangia caeni]|uniref:phosphotransferase family protein n=1 Tax=Ruicaihuangia caeni TaxID=3042517 RepID=UPI00338D63E6